MSAATTSDAPPEAAAALEGLQPPKGVIIPPRGEIREAIEKTAGYVMRGGIGLEERIRGNHGTNPKFSFLMSGADPYNAYYEWRKAEIKAGRGTAVSAGRAADPSAAESALHQAPKGPPRPADLHFSARMPRMSQKDLEIVRLTALFVAKNGRPFMTQLGQREAGNPQFQFLIPNHTFHNFFQSMVDQYSILIREGGVNGEGNKAQQERVAELRHNIEDKFHVLARAKQRAVYAEWVEAEKAKQEEEEEKKKIEFGRIDWNDFVIVETIVFHESDAQANLPPPTTLNDLQYASLEEKNRASVANANSRIEEAFPFEDTYYNAHPVPEYGVQGMPAETQQPAVAPAPTPAPAAPPPPPAPANVMSPSIRVRAAEDAEESQRIQEREQARERVLQAQMEARGGAGPMKIRENYVPRAAQRGGSKADAQMAVCPNCKQQIAVDELEQHMRIELLDPRWKEQKAKAESRNATTNLSTVDVANNLKRLASQRTDVFDSITGEPVSEEELTRRKKIALNSFDGNPDGKSGVHINHLQNFNLDEQIRAIHQKFAPDKK